MIKFPSLKYQVILADPPWHFDTWSGKGQEKSPSKHYQTMLDKDIEALPVTFAAADDCVLFMWVTWPKLMQFDAPVHRIIRSWGFKPSGLAWEWIKKNPDTGKYRFGGGYGTRKNLEPCIMATRGNPKRKSASERDFMYGKYRGHSRKPDEQYERIERLFDGPYLELFARQTAPGWDVWGDEVNKFDFGVD